MITLIRGVTSCVMLFLSSVGLQAADLFSAHQDLNKGIFGKTIYFNCYSASDSSKKYPSSFKLEKKPLRKKSLSKLSHKGHWEELPGKFNDTSLVFEEFDVVDKDWAEKVKPGFRVGSINGKSTGFSFGFTDVHPGGTLDYKEYQVLRDVWLDIGILDSISYDYGKQMAIRLAQYLKFIPVSCQNHFHDLFHIGGAYRKYEEVSFIKGTYSVGTSYRTFARLFNHSCKSTNNLNFVPMTDERAKTIFDKGYSAGYAKKTEQKQERSSWNTGTLVNDYSNAYLQFQVEPDYRSVYRKTLKCEKVGN